MLRLGGLGARMQNAVKLGVWRVITLQPGGVGRGVATANPDLYNMYVNIYIYTVIHDVILIVLEHSVLTVFDDMLY